MSAVQNTILQPGAEFRPLRDLEPLFHHHIDWEKFVTLCTVGAEYCFKDNLEYSEERRLDDLRHAIERGNNKSALDPEDAPFIQKNQTKEVEKGWMIPIRKDSVLKIPGAGVIPLGIAEQITIDAQGNRIPKKRFTHDLSRPMKSGMSVNNMIDDDKLDPCLFGHCLLRLLHRIQKLRLRHGWTPILSSKIDLDAAFRRLHMSYPHALLSIVIVEQIAYLLGRMTFGSKIGPGKHDIPSNMVVDLAQMLLDDPSWDPATLHSPDADKIPLKETLTGDIPFGQAFPLAVPVDDSDHYVDGYVDDLCTICIDDPSVTEKARHAVALAIHTVYRPANKDDPLPRDSALCLRKLLAEGRLEERKVILGWLIDTRRFIIQLPRDKATRWIQDIDVIIHKIETKQWITTREWESLTGKCNTAAYIFREGRFFLSRFRYRIKQSKLSSKGAKGAKSELNDAKLWRRYMGYLASTGISINHATCTLPSLFTKQDASTKALGGFNCLGLAWRFILHPDLHEVFHINLLEFMAVVVTIWLSIITLDIKDGQGMKILAQTDNTSALGWLQGQTRYDPDNIVSTTLREMIGRKLAEVLMDAKLSLYSQHIQGEHNHIADHLSRNVDMTNSQQLHSIQEKFPQHTPDHLRIIELPPMISSWLQSVMETGILMLALPKERQTSLLAACRNGNHSPRTPDWTFSSEVATSRKRFKSSVLSRTESDIIMLARRLGMNLEETQFKPQSSVYQRPSGRMATPTPSDLTENSTKR